MVRLVGGYVWPYRRRLSFALAGMVVFTLFSLSPPLILRVMVDDVVQEQVWTLLPIVAAAYALAPMLAATIRFFSMRLVMLASRRVIADIRLDLYRKILNLSMRYHGEHSAGATVSRLMDDVNMMERLLTGETITMVVDVVVVVVAFALAFSISSVLAGMSCVLIALYVVAYKFFAKRIRVATESYRGVFDRIAGRLQETVAGVRQVRIYRREEWENTLFLDRTVSSLDMALAGSMGTVNLSVACTAVSGFGSVGIFGLGAYMVLQGDLSYGDLVAFGSYMWMLISPVTRLTNMAGQFVEVGVSIRRIADVLNEKQDIQSIAGSSVLTNPKGGVEFRDVHFSYSSENPLFEGISLEIAPGTAVALVGQTGCGKTTVTSLLMRYWDVQKGSILIDGVDIRTLELGGLRNLFGVVLQDPVVFDATVKENIAYGDARASNERLESVIQTVGIADLIDSLPDGLNTQLGSGGVKLSVGEKQRISIARAILRDPVILIMDEATSSLDSESEAVIQQALGKILRNRTSFVVAHRLSTIVNSDMIVVMDQGRIDDVGTHDELLLRNRIYEHCHRELRGEGQGEAR